MPFHSFVASRRSCSFALALALSSTTALANDATDQIRNWFDDVQDSGATIAEFAQLEEVGDDGAKLHKAHIVYPVSFDLGDAGAVSAKLAFRANEITFEYLNASDDGVNFERFAAPGVLEAHLIGTLTTPANGDKPIETLPLNFMVRYNDTDGSGVFIPALPELSNDPKKPISKYLELAKLYLKIKIASLTAKSVDVEQNMPYGDRQVERYEGASVSGVENGVIAQQLIARHTGKSSIAEIGEQEEKPYEFKLSTGEMEIRGIDYKPLFYQLGLIDEKPASNILHQSTTLKDVELNDDSKSSFSIKNTSIGEVTVDTDRQPVKIGPLLDEVALSRKFDEDAVLTSVLNIISSYKVENATLEGLSFRHPDAKGAASEVSFSGGSASGIESLAIKGVMFAAGEMQTFELANFEIKDFGIPPLENYAALAATPPNETPSFSQIMSVIPTLGHASIEGMQAKTPEFSAPISLTNWSLDMGAFISSIPTRIESETRDFIFPVEALSDDMIVAIFKEIDLNKINYNENINVTYDELTEILDVERYEMKIIDGVEARVSLKIGGVKRAVFESPKQYRALMANAKVIGGRVTISKAPLIGAFIAHSAKEEKISPETLAYSFADELKKELGPLANTPFGTSLHAALKTFLINNKEIDIEVAPQSPVPVTQILGVLATDPSKIPEVLGASVHAAQ